MSWNGWLILDKPVGLSSAAVVSKVKHLLKPHKIGHGGTLDPLASGVLPLALGEATKVCSFMLDTDKAYEFTVRWGEKRDTDDAEGQVIATSSIRPQASDIQKVLPCFRGKIHQYPPLYCAIKVQGKRACDRLRQGERVELASRLIEIYDIILQTADATQACFYVKCSKGTYVRSLARDLAQALGTYGYVSALKRVQSGKFYIKDALMLEKLAKAPEKGLLKRYIRPIHSVLDDIPAVVIREDERERLRKGQCIMHTKTLQGVVSVFDESQLFIGLAYMSDHIIRPKRLMVYNSID